LYLFQTLSFHIVNVTSLEVTLKINQGLVLLNCHLKLINICGLTLIKQYQRWIDDWS